MFYLSSFRARLRLAAFSAFFTVTPSDARAQDGLVALYTFKEGSGNVVRDVSGMGTPLDLVIANPAAVSWLPDGGVSFDGQTIIASPVPAAKIVQACQESNEWTVEAWVKPANLIQAGPARLVSLSANPTNRDFTMGQDTDFWIMRVRTPVTGNNGSANNTQFNSFAGTAQTRLTHVVFTRDAFETDTFYIDGVESEIRFSVGGEFSNWNATYRLGLGGELDNSRQWLGEIHRVAIYNRALKAAEVAQIYDQLTLKLDVLEVSPARGTHFHPAAGGIRFRAVALRNNTIAASGIKLTLNGEDRSSALQITGSTTDRQVTFMGLEPNRSYQGGVTITDNQGATRSAALDFQTYMLRPDGLVALYTFEEGSGPTIRDRSEAGPPLDLTIADTSGVRWLPGGGLAIDAEVSIAS
ncbi:MAG: LamG domain-containing protein, partial [Verrucomicrobia bacterium]|nr:LamG domain-containing protein [Verrucomicrobiota bacterium]